MIYVRHRGTGAIDRVTGRREANRQRPRLALAGGLSAVTRPFPPLLFPDWREVRRDWQQPEMGREGASR